MILTGTLVNALAIIVGTLVGLLFTKISEQMKTTVMQAMGLAVIVLGISMGMKSEEFLILILSLAFGAMLGELLKLEDLLNRLGNWIENRFQQKSVKGNISQAFVTATLVFVTGALAIIGALDSGLRSDHSILFTKAIIDGFVSLIFTTTLGFGVIFSAIPVLLYEGSIALMASFIEAWIPDELMDQLINELTAVGGVLILSIGLNLLDIIKIRVVNLLPALIFVVIFMIGQYYWL